MRSHTFEKAYRRHLLGRIDELEQTLKAVLGEVNHIWGADGVDEDELIRELERARNVLAQGARIFRTYET